MNMSECIIKFRSPVSRATVSLLVVDFLKYVLYYRGQFPLPLEQLKRSLKKRTEISTENKINFCTVLNVTKGENFVVFDDHAKTKSIPISQEIPSFIQSRAEQIFVEAVIRFDEVFEQLSSILEKGGILEVILNLGSNMLLPKELYRILLPSWCHHQECITDASTFQRCRLQFYQSVMSSSIWNDLSSDRPLSISIFLLLAPGVSLTENMEQKRFYSVPKHCKQRTVRFCDNCNKTFVNLTESSLDALSVTNPELQKNYSENSALWVKLKPDLRGFKSNSETNNIVKNMMLR